MALIALLEFITNLDQMLSPVCEVRMWSNTRAEKASPDRLLFLDEKDEKNNVDEFFSDRFHFHCRLFRGRQHGLREFGWW